MTRPTRNVMVLVTVMLSAHVGAAQPSPGTEGETLLAAEQAFAAAAAQADVVRALTAM
jgi:hypothetical protein